MRHSVSDFHSTTLVWLDDGAKVFLKLVSTWDLGVGGDIVVDGVRMRWLKYVAP